MGNMYYVDGKFVADSDACFPINDLGLLRGFGCFDFMRTYHGKVIFIKDHVQRLCRSARQIGIELPFSETEVIHLVEETLRRNPPVESNVRILVTGGSSPDFITPQGRPRIAIMVASLSQYPAAWYAEGAKVITVPHTRTIPGAKSIDYIRAIMVLAEARQKGAIEAVYVDPEGWVREGTTCNIFAVVAGRLVTPGHARDRHSRAYLPEDQSRIPRSGQHPRGELHEPRGGRHPARAQGGRDVVSPGQSAGVVGTRLIRWQRFTEAEAAPIRHD